MEQRVPADVQAVLDELQAGARAVLGAQFAGMYLYGSLASGDFSPETSDVDFVVSVHTPVTPEQFEGLRALHERLAASEAHWAHKLEGAYVPEAGLRRYDAQAAPCPSVNEGQFYWGGQGSDWIIQRHILREQGVRLAGPDLKGLIDPVPAADLRGAVVGVVLGWWEPMLAQPARLQSPEYQAYAVLCMCRVFYTLETGEIASKPASARWALGPYGAQYGALIRAALDWRPDLPFDRLSEVLAWVALAVERCHAEGKA